MVQLFPSNPGTQVQVYLFTPSTHVPLFSQGLGLQSSISDEIIIIIIMETLFVFLTVQL